MARLDRGRSICHRRLEPVACGRDCLITRIDRSCCQRWARLFRPTADQASILHATAVGNPAHTPPHPAADARHMMENNGRRAVASGADRKLNRAGIRSHRHAGASRARTAGSISTNWWRNVCSGGLSAGRLLHRPCWKEWNARQRRAGGSPVRSTWNWSSSASSPPTTTTWAARLTRSAKAGGKGWKSNALLRQLTLVTCLMDPIRLTKRSPGTDPDCRTRSRAFLQ